MTPTVLVVEDEVGIAEWMASNLRAAGYRVLAAGHGRGALREAQNHLPDIILLDLTLPDLDGTSVCELLHCLPSTRHTPVILISAPGDGLLPDQAMRAGACGQLSKPMSPEVLLDRVHQALAAAECATLVRRVLAEDQAGDAEVDSAELRDDSERRRPDLVGHASRDDWSRKATAAASE